MPDFSQSATEDIDTTVQTGLKSPFGSLHKRSPATHLDTSAATHNDVLIPVAPGPADAQDPPRSNPFPRNPSGPPIPAPKPASLIAKMNPQSGASGAAMTVSEEIHLAMLPSTESESPTEPKKAEQTIAHFEIEEATEESEEEEEEEGLGRDDGVSAFIRELQSSITVSRSDSGSSSVAAARVLERVTAKNITRTDSTSSRTSQLVREVATPKSVGSDPTRETGNLSRHGSVSEQYDRSQNFEYAQLETAQFEWTFTDLEQTTYERIYSLWERPAEECVSSDIAGKVYMTLGLKNTDLFKMWQLINPDEKSVLSRTYFIAGLHLVNSRVVGYELPDELPDELMVSAAGVGRIKVPPRPVQGPNTIVESAPSVPQPTYAYADKAPPPQPSYSAPDKSAPSSQGISSFMPNYSLSFAPPETPSEIYQAYPTLPSIAEMEKQRQQIQQQEPMATYHPVFGLSPPVQAKQPVKSGYSSSSSNSSPANSNTLVQVQRPGPHAVHNVGMTSYFDDELSQSQEVNSKAITTPGTTSRSFTTTTTTAPITTTATANNPTSATQVAMTQNSHSIHNAALYALPPNAWDHDAAAPELDVEGNYIKYRSDFKNDMTVSASVTANHPINPKSGVFYFEIMIDRFKGNSPISFGIAGKNLRKNLQVGWDLNSWGFHSDNGLYFGNSQQNIAFEFGYAEGDTVGCGVNFLEKSVFFTLNGDMLGVAF
ncbi:hypothetical protein BGZ93_009306, partial [Podila epicladia]